MVISQCAVTNSCHLYLHLSQKFARLIGGSFYLVWSEECILIQKHDGGLHSVKRIINRAQTWMAEFWGNSSLRWISETKDLDKFLKPQTLLDLGKPNLCWISETVSLAVFRRTELPLSFGNHNFCWILRPLFSFDFWKLYVWVSNTRDSRQLRKPQVI